jgi:endonuclease/exonuclease/phosphatase family metal-dependent hydrolase
MSPCARVVLVSFVVAASACRREAPPAPGAPTSAPAPRDARHGEPTGAASLDGARAASAPTGARPPVAKLKLATWNLEWLSARLEAGVVKRRQEDYERLAKYADRLDADVVAFQEVDGEAAARRVFSPERYDFHVAGEGGVQRTGFAYKRGLAVVKHPDYRELDVGGVRVGADLTVRHGPKELRLLAVHLKSGCFEGPLTKPSNACEKLARQLPKLEAWIDARASERTPFAVLGDFNRRLLARPDEPFPSRSFGTDPFWAELDDSEPPEADLTSPAAGRGAECWGAKFPDFISHIVLGKSAALLVEPGSFTEHAYDAADRPKKGVLSDHCPLSVVIRSTPSERPAVLPTANDAGVAPPPSSRTAEPESASGPIKGNINAKGKKIYHLPSCPDYARTKVTRPGERFFSSEGEAKAAGFEKARNCPN